MDGCVDGITNNASPASSFTFRRGQSRFARLPSFLELNPGREVYSNSGGRVALLDAIHHFLELGHLMGPYGVWYLRYFLLCLEGRRGGGQGAVELFCLDKLELPHLPSSKKKPSASVKRKHKRIVFRAVCEAVYLKECTRSVCARVCVCVCVCAQGVFNT